MRISDWSSDVCSSDLTTLAQIVARELGVGFRATSGPIIVRAGDLAALLTNLQPRDVLFIDEIHRLSPARSEEHTSELQSLMRISYAVFCLTKKKININIYHKSLLDLYDPQDKF